MSFFSSNVDEILSFLLGLFYFFTGIITNVKAGKLTQMNFVVYQSLDYFYQSVWRCYLSLFSLSCSISCFGFFMMHNCLGKLSTKIKSISRTSCIQ